MIWAIPHTVADLRVKRFYRAVAKAQARRSEALAALSDARAWALEYGQRDPGAFQARHGKTFEQYLADVATMEAALSTGDAAA